MKLKDFKAGTFKNGAGYKYFLPEKINHSYVWTDLLTTLWDHYRFFFKEKHWRIIIRSLRNESN